MILCVLSCWIVILLLPHSNSKAVCWSSRPSSCEGAHSTPLLICQQILHRDLRFVCQTVSPHTYSLPITDFDFCTSGIILSNDIGCCSWNKIPSFNLGCVIYTLIKLGPESDVTWFTLVKITIKNSNKNNAFCSKTAQQIWNILVKG